MSVMKTDRLGKAGIEEVYSMSAHYCDKCGKEMERTAKCEFYCADCDNTIFDFSLQAQDNGKKKQHSSDFELADFCRGGDLTED